MVDTDCNPCRVFSHYSVNACLLPLCSLHGMAVTTVEGIGSLRTRLHPVQVVHACMHTHTHTPSHAHTHTHTPLHMHTQRPPPHTHTPSYAHTDRDPPTHTHMHTHIHSCTPPPTHPPTHTHRHRQTLLIGYELF